MGCTASRGLKPDEIYAATSKGVLVVIRPDFKIYAANYKGVFEYNRAKARWSQLFKGAGFVGARFLSAAKDGALWVATDKGIFKTVSSYTGAAT